MRGSPGAGTTQSRIYVFEAIQDSGGFASENGNAKRFLKFNQRCYKNLEIFSVMSGADDARGCCFRWSDPKN